MILYKPPFQSITGDIAFRMVHNSTQFTLPAVFTFCYKIPFLFTVVVFYISENELANIF